MVDSLLHNISDKVPDLMKLERINDLLVIYIRNKTLSVVTRMKGWTPLSRVLSTGLPGHSQGINKYSRKVTCGRAKESQSVLISSLSNFFLVNFLVFAPTWAWITEWLRLSYLWGQKFFSHDNEDWEVHD